MGEWTKKTHKNNTIQKVKSLLLCNFYTEKNYKL